MRQTGRTGKDQQPRTPMRIDNLFEGLEQLLSRTETAATRTGSDANWVLIADYLTQIRVLLMKLTRLAAGRGETDALSEKLNDLAARYFCLEGRIKEIRNDGCVPARSHAI